MNLLKFDEFLNESVEIDFSDFKKLKFKWKRAEASKGKFSFLDNNNLRGYECSLNGIEIGFLSNVSKGDNSKDNSKQWQIWFIAKGERGNIVLKKKFEFDQVAEAKKYFEVAFVKIMSSNKESEKLFKMKEDILDLGRIKAKEKNI